MKRVLFLLISVFVAGTTYATNLSKDVIAKVTNESELSVSDNEQSSYIKPFVDKIDQQIMPIIHTVLINLTVLTVLTLRIILVVSNM